MRVFVAGGSGVLGRRLVPQLVARGHQVTATTTSGAKLDLLTRLGAEAVVMDGLDAGSVHAAVAAAAPDVIVHQMTGLSFAHAGKVDLKHPDKYFAATNRLRVAGTDHLLAAADAAGVTHVVAQSNATGNGPDDDGWTKPEQKPLDTAALPAAYRLAMEPLGHIEASVINAGGAALRYGWFYGPGTYFGRNGATEADVRRRRFPVIGKGTGLFSFIHVDAAAAATVAAVQRGAPGVYNIVDDKPAPMREWLPAYAETIGAKRPLHIPAWLARLAAGPTASLVSRQPGAANNKAKDTLGWTPIWPSWQEGFQHAPR